MQNLMFTVLMIRDGEGWAAVCPEFPDCRARGDNSEEALSALRNTISTYIEDSFGDDEPLPQSVANERSQVPFLYVFDF
jgi:predicted RNase H-like HicB family nuclease